MIYTIESILSNPAMITAVINRLQVTLPGRDNIDWVNYLTPKKANPDGTFKTYSGTMTGVIVGSFIDKYSGKPIRKRPAMSKGFGEVASLGEKYQMDVARLEEMQILIETLNLSGNNVQTVNDIVNFLADDFRQCLLAPNKRMDLMLNDLKFKGKAEVRSNVDQKGVKIQTVTLPLNKLVPVAGDKANFISYLETEVNKHRAKGADFAIAEMNRSTFRQYIVGCEEFKSSFVSKFGAFEYKPEGLATPDMANALFESIELPLRIRLKSEFITMQDGATENVVPNKVISLLPNEMLGNLRWKDPYELTDRIATKTYNPQGNGLYIATERDENGRYMEYGAEWIVDIDKPNRMGLVDLSAF